MNTDSKEDNKTANKVLVIAGSVAFYTVFWLYILEYINAKEVIGPNIRVLFALVGLSTAATYWVYKKYTGKGNEVHNYKAAQTDPIPRRMFCANSHKTSATPLVGLTLTLERYE